MLVEFECKSKRVVDFSEFVESDAANEVAEPFRGNGRGLFDKYLRFLVVDGDGWTKRSSRSGSRGRGNEQCRQHEIVGLNDHRESCALLFMSSCISWRAKAMNVTTHGFHPCPPKRVGSPRGLLHRS